MNVKQLDQQYIINSYKRFDLALLSGKGATAADDEGNEYIDLTSGIGVTSLGYCDDEWAAAVSAQAHTLQHTSNLYYTKPCAELAQLLMKATGMARVFFGNSGAEANEGMIKVARKYSTDRYQDPKRTNIITLKNSFHGRTVMTLEATGQEVFHQNFYPFTNGFLYAEANNMNDIQAKTDDTVCAIMIEPVQGEGGVCPLQPSFVQQLRAFCDEHDLLLLVDEVQTGAGRTGSFLAIQQFGVEPDVVSMAKGLGGGLPIGAVCCNEKTKSVLGYGDHGSTFGGNPVVCAGAKVCVERIADEAFLQEVQKKGEYIRKSLSEVDEIESITGMGLMLGLKLKTKKSGEVAAAAIQNGVLVLTAKEKVRLLPPLTISYDELDKGLAALKKTLTE